MLHFSLKYGDVIFPKQDNPPGSVITYFLTQEELAEVHRKYGPPGKYAGQKRPFNIWADIHTKTSRTGKKRVQ